MFDPARLAPAARSARNRRAKIALAGGSVALAAGLLSTVLVCTLRAAGEDDDRPGGGGADGAGDASGGGAASPGPGSAGPYDLGADER